MALAWATALVDEEFSKDYCTPPRKADSYDECIQRVRQAIELHAPSVLVDATGEISAVSSPRYMPHVLLDLTGSDCEVIDLEQLVATVPLFNIIFEAGRIQGKRDVREKPRPGGGLDG